MRMTPGRKPVNPFTKHDTPPHESECFFCGGTGTVELGAKTTYELDPEYELAPGKATGRTTSNPQGKIHLWRSNDRSCHAVYGRTPVYVKVSDVRWGQLCAICLRESEITMTDINPGFQIG